ncbi:MAG: prepilin-type N-terminal cleavage/methylation domain-containing protein [Candidatus Tectomicrobia bacterium]|uniref:Prepilin-type N-terminal cleavage/methylation domain-containing protein n=1 Tax=Tectimicrobiota bacterium TaxID=2528274 RepID=A0A932FX84_UNCTE|nr:prepilin-type N-terminal cleavage/methylation domain-containing protein [Candidatus Tectomicrobia bacterium]
MSVLRPFLSSARKPMGERGFTLIEIFIALVVFTVALLSLASLLYTVVKGNAFSQKTALAVARAQERIEAFKNAGYSSLSSGSGSDTPETGVTRSWVVTVGSPAPSMATVAVTVSWTDLDGKSRSMALSTIISQ